MSASAADDTAADVRTRRAAADRPRRDRGSAGCASRCCTSSSWAALLFAVDHSSSSRADDPHTIVVGAEVDQRGHRDLQGRARPRARTREELTALRRVWLDNEVLYREGLALQVDKGDTAIRERVIFKALSVIDSNVKLPPADDDVLRKWFEGHRDKYDEPARYDFEEAALVRRQLRGGRARLRRSS